MQELVIVVDLESDPPQALGNYLRTDEDTVIYRRPAGDNGYAPCDCVQLVTVRLFDRAATAPDLAAEVADALTPRSLRHGR
jgi:hypothetical protein